MVLTFDSNQQPFLSIIIATLDDEGRIEECLGSIIKQTVIDKIEILVKDGGSTDRTIEILKKHDKYICYWESSHDSGIYDAWNTVISKATGQWILFLGADDTLFDDSVVSALFTILEKSGSTIDLAYGNVRLVTNSKEKILDAGKNWDKSRKCIKEKMCIPHQGILHNRSLFIKHGYFSTDYLISSDYEFIRRVLDTSKVVYLDMLISCMEVGGISSNPKYTFERLKEIRTINKKYGRKMPGVLWLLTYSNTCVRHGLYFLIGEVSTKYVLDRLRMIVGLPSFWTKT